MGIRQVLVLLFVATIVLTPIQGAEAGPTSELSTGQAEARFVALINSTRGSRGLSTLTVDGQLTGQARAWSRTMAGDGRLRHAGDLSVGITSKWEVLGENVGTHDVVDIDRLYRAFVESPAHLANLVDPRFDRVGVGVAFDAQGRVWTTHRFMAVPGAAPAPTTTAPPPPTTVQPTTTTTEPPTTTTTRPPTTRPPTTTPPTNQRAVAPTKPRPTAPPTTSPPTTEPPTTRRPITTAEPATTRRPTTRRPATTARPTTTRPPTTRRPTTEPPTTRPPVTARRAPSTTEPTTGGRKPEPIQGPRELVTTAPPRPTAAPDPSTAPVPQPGPAVPPVPTAPAPGPVVDRPGPVTDLPPPLFVFTIAPQPAEPVPSQRSTEPTERPSDTTAGPLANQSPVDPMGTEPERTGPPVPAFYTFLLPTEHGGALSAPRSLDAGEIRHLLDQLDQLTP